jgi:hypothetical protein
LKLSADDRNTLKRASLDADNWRFGGQAADPSFKHSMRGVFQPVNEARAETIGWIKYCLNLAADFQRGGSRMEAMYRLGVGMHAHSGWIFTNT